MIYKYVVSQEYGVEVAKLRPGFCVKIVIL